MVRFFIYFVLNSVRTWVTQSKCAFCVCEFQLPAVIKTTFNSPRSHLITSMNCWRRPLFKTMLITFEESGHFQKAANFGLLFYSLSIQIFISEVSKLRLKTFFHQKLTQKCPKSRVEAQKWFRNAVQNLEKGQACLGKSLPKRLNKVKSYIWRPFSTQKRLI